MTPCKIGDELQLNISCGEPSLFVEGQHLGISGESSQLVDMLTIGGFKMKILSRQYCEQRFLDEKHSRYIKIIIYGFGTIY